MSDDLPSSFYPEQRAGTAKNFAEVILPLPLFASFTYSVPEEMKPYITVGSRVVVQFGRKKHYTGIVESFRSDPPGNFEIKPVMALLDEAPVVRYPQLKLWDWIAEYYLCSKGDVFKAAVPTGLKPESETWISLNRDFELPEGKKLTEREEIVIQFLEDKKKVRLSELEDKLKLSRSNTLVARMLEKGILEIAETFSERYRPKTQTCIRLTADRNNPESLHSVFDSVRRAPQQEKALMAYLDLSKWMKRDQALAKVPREVLEQRSGVSLAVLNAMRDKGIFEIYKVTVNRFNMPADDTVNLSPLSDKQQKALDEINEQWRNRNVVLFRGVTGSGKTEIYTHLIKRVIERGDQALFLVPEISLTTQLTDRLRLVFGNRLLVYHSRFSDNERVDLWKKMLSSNEPYVIIGARSAVFLPFARLGLVIVDEEHEPSFKQYDPAPRYNARDTAIVLANMHGAKTLLGSATPSVESYYKAKTGKYGLVELESRFDDSPLPDVQIVDMKRQRQEHLNTGIFSSPLVAAVNEAVKEDNQVILFQNRRGFAPVVVCKACGWTPKCENCDVSPVYHKNTDSLHCHYCGWTATRPSVCPACGENAIEVFGYGTERIEEEISENFGEARIARMDLDTTRNKDAYHDIITDFSNRKTDILIGTQMVSKGLDFDKVKIVGVLNADTLLNHPDFRSNEKGFNMLEQVAGRAGRRKDKGTVFIQTTDTSNRILDFVKRHDYVAYYDAEIEERKKLNYPPFSRIIMVYVKNKDPELVEAASLLLAAALRDVFGARVLGPDKPFISRVATFYLRHIMLKIETEASLPKVKAILRSIYESLARDPRIKSSVLYYDVDPY